MSFIPAEEFEKDLPKNKKESFIAEESFNREKSSKSKLMKTVDAINNVGGGFVKGLASPVTGLMQLAGMPKESVALHPPFMDEGSFGAKAGEFGGNLASYFAGSAALAPLKIAQRTKALWEGNKLAPIANIMPELVGNAAFGAVSTPDTPEEGAAIGGASALASPILGKIVNAFKNLDAPQYAKALYDQLTGSVGPEKNAANVLQKIKEMFHEKRSFAGNRYEDIFDELEEKGGINNLKTDKFKKSHAELMKQNSSALSGLEDRHQKMLNNLISDKEVNPKNLSLREAPKNVREAHELQSELGKLSRDFLSSQDKGDVRLGGMINNLRQSLRSNLREHLEQYGLHEPYEKVTDYYRKNVLPYSKTKTLREITSGRKTGDANFLSSFKRPNSLEEETALGAPEIEPNELSHAESVAKIGQHGGDEFKNMVIAEFLRPAYKGGRVDKDILLSRLEDLESAGLGPYMTEHVKMGRKILTDKNKRSMLIHKKVEPFQEKVSNLANKITPEKQNLVNKSLMSIFLTALNGM